MDNSEDFSTKTAGFFAREERSILRGDVISILEKNYPREGEIWKAKNGRETLYPTYFVKIVTMAYDCLTPIVIYNVCEENGIYKSIREDRPDGSELIIHQPFCTNLFEFYSHYERYKNSSLSI